jgi:bifunctional non-homologous end joining protein LigD
LYKRLQKENAEGIVWKRMDAPYKQGRAGQHKKTKFWKTVDCFVTKMNPDGHESVELSVCDDAGKPHRISDSSLIGKEKNGRIGLGDVLEVKCLYSSEELHIIQPTILRKRDDKLASECGIDQVRLIVNKNWRKRNETLGSRNRGN